MEQVNVFHKSRLGHTEFARETDNFQQKFLRSMQLLDLPKNFAGLDQGAGTGLTTKYVLQLNPSHITLTDITKEALDVAKRTLLRGMDDQIDALCQKLQFEVADMLTINTREQYDLAYSLLATHELSDWNKQRFFTHTYDLLKSSGQILIGDVFISEDSHITKKLWENHYRMISDLDEEQYSYWKDHFDTIDYHTCSTKNFYIDCMKEAGFKDIDVSYAQGMYGIIYGRKK